MALSSPDSRCRDGGPVVETGDPRGVRNHGGTADRRQQHRHGQRQDHPISPGAAHGSHRSRLTKGRSVQYPATCLDMRPLTPRYAGLLIVAVLLALTAQGATVPHTHTGAGVGLFNQEHDLTLLATA